MHTDRNTTQHESIPARTFVIVWIGLLVLTILTVMIAKLHIGRASMLIPLLLASAKASLVLWFFMHLKHENRLFKVMLFLPIATITVIIGLTFFDIWYR